LERALLSWSGGKDSALALLSLESERPKKIELVALLTTLTEVYDRISMHGVRRELLHMQSASFGVPVEEVWIPQRANNETYESRMAASIMKRVRDSKISSVVFGDLFLEDVRRYREKSLTSLGVRPVFPLWGKDTGELARFFIDSGFRAKVCCVNPKLLGGEFCGREFDRAFLEEIPGSVDPCGENGEFHTFVYDGPIFRNGRVDVRVGEVVNREGFYFADLTLA
jgi:uncharacterized protein (TIGR00290 family)